MGYSNGITGKRIDRADEEAVRYNTEKEAQDRLIELKNAGYHTAELHVDPLSSHYRIVFYQ